MLSNRFRATHVLAGFGLGIAALSAKNGDFAGFAGGLSVIGLAAIATNAMIVRKLRLYPDPHTLGLGVGMWIAHTAATFLGIVFSLIQLGTTIHRAADNAAVTALTILAVTAVTAAQMVTIARVWGAYRQCQTYASEAAQRAARRRP